MSFFAAVAVSGISAAYPEYTVKKIDTLEQTYKTRLTYIFVFGLIVAATAQSATFTHLGRCSEQRGTHSHGRE